MADAAAPIPPRVGVSIERVYQVECSEHGVIGAPVWEGDAEALLESHVEAHRAEGKHVKRMADGYSARSYGNSRG